MRGDFYRRNAVRVFNKTGLSWLALARTTFTNLGLSMLLTATPHGKPPSYWKIPKSCFHKLLLSSQSPPCTCMYKSFPRTVPLGRFCLRSQAWKLLLELLSPPYQNHGGRKQNERFGVQHPAPLWLEKLFNTIKFQVRVCQTNGFWNKNVIWKLGRPGLSQASVLSGGSHFSVHRDAGSEYTILRPPPAQVEASGTLHGPVAAPAVIKYSKELGKWLPTSLLQEATARCASLLRTLGSTHPASLEGRDELFIAGPPAPGAEGPCATGCWQLPGRIWDAPAPPGLCCP